MGIFDRFINRDPAVAPISPTPPAAPAPVGINLAKGNVSLAKGQSITLEKRPNTKITAVVRWKSGTDYDVYALVLFKDGHIETASYFGTHVDPKYTPTVANGAVRHLGDIGRDAGKSKSGAEEIVEITLNDNIVCVVPVAYSAQSNGTGSFKRYKVTLEVDNGLGDKVTIDAKNANGNDMIYTCVPAIIWNRPHGAEIEAVELYSRPGSENRPALSVNGQLQMDAGPTNIYK